MRLMQGKQKHGSS
ncbi:hypothetical protein CFP56_006056 [Quercus suber]